MAHRSALLLVATLVAVALFLGTASAASHCETLPGCTSCAYVLKSGLAVLNCTACAAPAYNLTDAGACACSSGHYSRFTNGTRTGRCDPVPDGFVAAAGAINNTANILRECLNSSVPDSTRAKCLCLPGFYAAVNGQVPTCKACSAAVFTNETNTRTACVRCPVGHVANTDNTGCVAVSTALNNSTAAANKTSANKTGLITNVRRNVTSAVKLTLNETRSVVSEVRRNVTSAVNATLFNLRHPVAALKTGNLTANTLAKVNVSSSLGKVTGVASNGLVRLANATGAAELASAWSALQDRGLPALIPNFSDGINVNVTSAMTALAKVAGAISQNDTARQLLVTVLSKLVEAALGSATSTSASG